MTRTRVEGCEKGVVVGGRLRIHVAARLWFSDVCCKLELRRPFQKPAAGTFGAWLSYVSQERQGYAVITVIHIMTNQFPFSAQVTRRPRTMILIAASPFALTEAMQGFQVVPV